MSRSRFSSIFSPIERAFGVVRPHRRRSHAAERHRRARHFAVLVFFDEHGGRDDGEVAVPAREFDEGIAVARRPAGKRHAGKKLIELQCRRHIGHRKRGKSMLRAPFLPTTEILASSAAATETSSAAGSRWHSDPPSVPRLRVCRCPTWRDGLVHQRTMLPHHAGKFDIALARHGPDLERALAFADEAQILDPVEIDDMIRQHVAHVQHRHQRLPAGEQFGVVETAEKADHVGRRARIVIGKSGGFIGRDFATPLL